ncbi:MAG: LysM peptidoglycan-binding domain-containing protein [Anaerolineales bacterium]|nr:LysM peptidoglycan-binding domain-containing protein [Anaerolineales bacterium]
MAAANRAKAVDLSPGNSTPSPTLSSIQKLTPEADGRYYHTVQSGETLFWISGLYDVSLTNLMAWNGLDAASVIRPGQKLLLLVTTPPTATAIETPTLPPTPVTPSASPSAAPPPTGTPLAIETETSSPRGFSLILILGAIVLVTGGLLWWRFVRKS